MRGSSLHSIINSLFDQTTNFGGIPQHVVSRDPQDFVPLLGQVPIAALIMQASFVGLTRLAIDLNFSFSARQQKSTV